MTTEITFLSFKSLKWVITVNWPLVILESVVCADVPRNITFKISFNCVRLSGLLNPFDGERW